MTPSALKPATLPCVVQCLSQIRHCVPHNYYVHPRTKFSLAGTNCLTQEVGNYKIHDHQMKTKICLSPASSRLINSIMKFICSSRSLSHLTKSVWLLGVQKTINSMGSKSISIHQYLAGACSPLPGKTQAKSARDIIQYIGVDINYTEI